jgi:hypothetical protein
VVRATSLALAVTAFATIAGCHRGDNASPTTQPTSTDIGQGSVLASGAAGPYISSPNGTQPVRSITGMVDGWNVVSPAPDRYTSDDNALLHDFGQDVAMAFGAKGQPVAVWASLTDPPNNGYTISASTLGPDQRWLPPVDVGAGTRLAPGPTGPILSVAGDPTTNVIAVATERRDDNGVATGIDLYLSADDGRSWSKTGATDTEAYRPTVAMSGSNLFVAYVGPTGAQLITSVLPPVKRDAKDALDGADLRTMTWATQAVPSPEGTTTPLGQAALAVDSQGRPAVVAAFAAPARNRRVIGFWRPGAARPQTVTETDASADSTDVVDLVFRDDNPIVSVADSANTGGHIATLAVSADGGTTYLPTVDVSSRDGERAPYGVTMAITAPPDRSGPGSTSSTAADATTAAADVVRTVGLAYLPDAGPPVDDADGCGLPRLATSTNLTEWKVCGPIDDDRRDPRAAVQPANLFQGVFAGPDGALYLPVTNRNPDGTLPAGIVVWRQPAG